MSILHMSASAGILILVIVVIRALTIDKLPKTMFAVLWGIALCRLIIPVSIYLKFSIFDAVNRIIQGVFLLKDGATNGNWAISGTVPKVTGYLDEIYKPLRTESLTILWITGAALLIIYFSVTFYKHYREIRTALPIQGNAMIDKWLMEHKLIRPVKILISDKITAPLTYGIIMPKIILPKSIDLGNELQMRYILTHEFIHIKHFDALWKLLLLIAVCVHWFNPIVWVLFVLMNRDLEIACDESVIKVFGEGTKAGYALSLISMEEQKTRLTPLYSSFSKNAAEERIVSIMKFKKTSAFSLILAFILIAGATSVFAERASKTVLQLYGIIRINSAEYIFSFDGKGIISVKDARGNVVSEATIDSDGKAILTDENEKVIKTVQLNILEEIRGEWDKSNGTIYTRETYRVVKIE